MNCVVLIRHGETDWNVEGRYQGQADPPLNTHGVAQAHQLAAELAAVGLECLYSSPLRRAWQTAQALANSLGLPLYSEPRLMEIHLGEWQGRLFTEIAAQDPDRLRRWKSEPWRTVPPGRETLPQVQARVYAALDDILAQHAGRCVGLVTHRIPIFLIKLRYQNLDRSAVHGLHLPNTYWEQLTVAAAVPIGEPPRATEGAEGS